MAALDPIRPLAWLRAKWRNLSPSAIFVGGFAALIAVGTVGLLALPGLVTGPRLDPVDALFTITSAVCVTGLTVVDTARSFTFWGQLWILLFIQVGGVGVIALTTLIIGAMGRRLSLRSEVIASPPVDISGRHDAGALVVATVKYTLAIEAAGAALLWALWLPRLGAVGAIWPAVFHAVSAFCNAGFSTFSANLAGDRDHPAVLAVVGALIVVGGFGYLSVAELLRWWRERGRVRRRISSHTFAALWVTGLLLAGGTALFAAFEWDGVLADLGAGDKLANAAFMAVTPRTAGFNAVPYAAVGNRTGFLTVLLMIVGGSPGSTAGGIKTTAVAVLAALAVARIRGRRHVSLHGRTVPEGTIQRTVSLSLLAFTLLAAALLLLVTTETRDAPAEGRALFLPLLFEAASAFGTVGLSMDLTPTLSAPGKLLLSFLMFVGRVGPLPFFAALALPPRAAVREIRAAHEDVIVG